MAFVPNLIPITQLRRGVAIKRASTLVTPCCNLWTTIGRTLAAPAAALLLTIAVVPPYQALADDAPLVFDHDQSLEGADFSNRNDLRGAIFSKSNCKKATFAGSDLSNSQLDDANVGTLYFDPALCDNVPLEDRWFVIPANSLSMLTCTMHLTSFVLQVSRS